MALLLGLLGASALPAPAADHPPDGAGGIEISGEFKQWHKVTLTLDGPFARERDTGVNPFTDLAFSVAFAHESGEPKYTVPGYFAADGDAANTSAQEGTKWRAHLSPDRPGRWTYAVSFAKGRRAAIEGGGDPLAPYDGAGGAFEIAPSDKSGRDFRGVGRLQYAGGHYLRFAGSREYFIKAGADSPETLLAYADFDGTVGRKGNAPLKTWQRNGEFVEEEGHVTDLLTREAVAFIGRKREGPFFLYVPYTAVHLPIDEPVEWLHLYSGESDPGVRQYGACVSHLDDGVGKILAALDAAGVRGDTIVIFLTDNGGSTGTQNNDTKYEGVHPSFDIPARNGSLRAGKGTVYEGGIRTPAILSWPGRLEPRDELAPVHVAEWFPTFAALAGYRPEEDLKWDGRNLWPVLTGEAAAEPRVLYWLGPGGRSAALRKGDLVMIRQKDKPDQLYDLAADPGQKDDLAAERPEAAEELARLLEQAAAADNDARVE